MIKYEDFIKNLNSNNVENVYIINGGESYLTTSALEHIENKLNITFADFNKTVYSDNSMKTAVDIVESCLVAPFGDERRLIIVHDYLLKKNEGEKNIFLKYFENPCSTTCLVFFSTIKSDFFESLQGKVTSIDCKSVSGEYLRKWILNESKIKNFSISQSAMDRLIDYSNSSITKVNVELQKLLTLNPNSTLITEEDIEENVTKDLEYVIFDLTNALSNKDSSKAYELIEAMLKNKEQPTGIIATLANHFRRLFLVARSNYSNLELSEVFSIKEFAIIKYKQQAQKFGQKKLKQIYDTCVQVEFMAKSGEMDPKNAVYYLVSNILI